VFTKKNQNILFITTEFEKEPKLLSVQEGLSIFKASIDEQNADLTVNFPNLFNFALEKLIEKHPLPAIRGRRSEAIKLLEALRGALPKSESYCTDLIKVISKYDDVSEGALKDIANVDLKKLESSFLDIQRIVPETFIKNVLDRIQRMEEQVEVILLAEEILT
jgi:hypothetical protein